MAKPATAYDEAERRRRILDAARATFVRYGYARTRMEDVAKAAGISRPLLYRQFAGKEDLFFALVSEIAAVSLARAEAALAGPGDPWARVQGAFEGWAEAYEQILAESGHAAELVSVTESVAGEVIAEGYEALGARLEAALAAAEEAGEIDLDRVGATPARFADLLVRASLGFKDDDGGHSRFAARMRTLVAALRAATAPS